MTGQVVLVDGQRVSIPGVYPEISPAALSQIIGSGERVPLVIGVSDGGLPGKVYAFSSYPEAAAVLRGGGALSYIARIFSPSPDLAGARRVLFVRLNGASSSSVDLNLSPGPGFALRIVGNFDSILPRFVVVEPPLYDEGAVFYFDTIIERSTLGPGDMQVVLPFIDRAVSGANVYIDSPIAEANMETGFYINEVLHEHVDEWPVSFVASSDTIHWAIRVLEPWLFSDYWTKLRNGVNVSVFPVESPALAVTGKAEMLLLDISRRVSQGTSGFVAVADFPRNPEAVSFAWAVTNRAPGVGSVVGIEGTDEWFLIDGPSDAPSASIVYSTLGGLDPGVPVATVGVDITYEGGTVHFERDAFIVYA